MRHVALLFAALCLLAPLAAVGGVATAGATGTDASRASTATPFTVSGTTFTVSLQEDGDARWTVAATYRFADEGSRDAFGTHAEQYRNNESTGGPSAEAFRNAAGVASNATGREMAVRDVNRTADVRNETTGVLRVRFTWTNFLESGSSGQLVLGDVFVTAPEETWFRTLQPGQRLVIEPPTGYAATDVSVPRSRIVNRNVVVEDPSTFAAGDISITYESTGSEQNMWGETPLIVGSAGLLVLLAAAGYIATQRRSGAWRDTDGEGGPEAVVPSTDSSGGGSGAVAGGADGRAGSDAGPAGAVVDGATASEPEPDPELLSDEERVERLLEHNGGRMRQADIVKETGWSDAKVSQLLSAMAEDGDVEKLRLGRENLISLPDGDERDDPRENGL